MMDSIRASPNGASLRLWETETPCGGGRSTDCGNGPGTRNNSWAWGESQFAYMRSFIESGVSVYSQVIATLSCYTLHRVDHNTEIALVLQTPLQQLCLINLDCPPTETHLSHVFHLIPPAAHQNHHNHHTSGTWSWTKLGGADGDGHSAAPSRSIP
jgi:hypothetical protein